VYKKVSIHGQFVWDLAIVILLLRLTKFLKLGKSYPQEYVI